MLSFKHWGRLGSLSSSLVPKWSRESVNSYLGPCDTHPRVQGSLGLLGPLPQPSSPHTSTLKELRRPSRISVKVKLDFHSLYGTSSSVSRFVEDEQFINQEGENKKKKPKIV